MFISIPFKVCVYVRTLACAHVYNNSMTARKIFIIKKQNKISFKDNSIYIKKKKKILFCFFHRLYNFIAQSRLGVGQTELEKECIIPMSFLQTLCVCIKWHKQIHRHIGPCSYKEAVCNAELTSSFYRFILNLNKLVPID